MKKIIIISIVLLLIISGWYYFIALNQSKQNEPIFCTLDAKICSDGSAVGRIPPKCEFAPCPKEDLLIVDSVLPNQIITSPLTIIGSARGSWYFEATFPVLILDEQGNILAEHYAEAKDSWMTNDFVPFEAVLNFKIPITQKGTIVLKKSNPSGLIENEDELRIPILFFKQDQEKKQMKEISLYYYNSFLDKDENENIKCSRDGLVEVKREIPITSTPIQDTINLLLIGKITEQEKNQGISTEYPLLGFSLKGASLKNGILTLEFDDPNAKTSGGSCRAGILWFQIEATAKQFSEVEQVRFLPEDIFQP